MIWLAKIEMRIAMILADISRSLFVRSYRVLYPKETALFVDIFTPSERR